jgi:hypothetical protein
MNDRLHRGSDVGEETLISAYLLAKETVFEAGFADEIDWQDDRSFDSVSEPDFLREAAWVILSAGMRECVVRKKFSALSQAFLEWESASAITQHKNDCRHAALLCFSHKAKINAILNLVEHVAALSYPEVRRNVVAGGLTYLETFAFIGPVTRYHFAKNLGLDVVKPDRHLMRISAAAGYTSPEKMCRLISRFTGEKIAVVDVVLWRFATLRSDYVSAFRTDCLPVLLND